MISTLKGRKGVVLVLSEAVVALMLRVPGMELIQQSVRGFIEL
ncbi:MAG: hypothetical protein ACK5TN_13815 [Acidobacteriota bacterium]